MYSHSVIIMGYFLHVIYNLARKYFTIAQVLYVSHALAHLQKYADKDNHYEYEYLINLYFTYTFIMCVSV